MMTRSGGYEDARRSVDWATGQQDVHFQVPLLAVFAVLFPCRLFGCFSATATNHTFFHFLGGVTSLDNTEFLVGSLVELAIDLERLPNDVRVLFPIEWNTNQSIMSWWWW